jgi:hypothetical protein
MNKTKRENPSGKRYAGWTSEQYEALARGAEEALVHAVQLTELDA